MLSDNTVKGEIAYGVVAGVIWISWVAVAIRSHLRSRDANSGSGAKAMGKSKAVSDSSPEGYQGNATA